MTLRRVSPLKHEDWVALVEEFKKGPSPEQARAVQEALEKKALEGSRRGVTAGGRAKGLAEARCR